MVEPLPRLDPSPTEPEDERRRMGIRTVTRTGIHIATHIDDTGRRDLRFVSRAMEIAEGRVLLRIDMENTGERSLNLDFWVQLIDGGGNDIGRFSAGRQGLYPGSSARMRVDFSGVPPGEYQAVVIADNQDEYVFGARYTIEIPGVVQEFD